LKEFIRVKELAAMVGGEAIVSPARSTNSDTEVIVKTSFHRMIQRMKQELREEYWRDQQEFKMTAFEGVSFNDHEKRQTKEIRIFYAPI
jgi:hypothetical protein